MTNTNTSNIETTSARLFDYRTGEYIDPTEYSTEEYNAAVDESLAEKSPEGVVTLRGRSVFARA